MAMKLHLLSQNEYICNVMNRIKHKVSSNVKRCKSDVLKGVRLAVRSQDHMSTGDIEDHEDFRHLVVAKTNPAIKQAKRKGISYTIERKGEIVEIHGTTQVTIGKVSKSDIQVLKGTVYKLTR